jgi:hypothetical protein
LVYENRYFSSVLSAPHKDPLTCPKSFFVGAEGVPPATNNSAQFTGASPRAFTTLDTSTCLGGGFSYFPPFTGGLQGGLLFSAFIPYFSPLMPLNLTFPSESPRFSVLPGLYTSSSIPILFKQPFKIRINILQ